MLLMTLRDVQHRLIRFLVVIVLMAVVLGLLFVMTGVAEQFHREPYDAVDAIGAREWVVPAGVSGPFTSTATLPEATVDAVDGGGRAPVVVARASLVDGTGPGGDSQEVVLVGHRPGALGAPEVVHGRGVEQRGEIVVDRSADLGVGRPVVVNGHPFTVVGEVADASVLAGVPLVFVDLGDAQAVAFDGRDVVSAVLLDGPPASVPSGLQVLDADDVAADTLEPLENAITSVDLIRFLLWVVAAIIIGGVIYLSALERQRDFAVLRAVGSSNRALAASLGMQAVFVAVVATAMALVVQAGLAPAFPLRVRVPARAYWQVPVLAVVLALASGSLGMRRVARADPAAAFAVPGA